MFRITDEEYQTMQDKITDLEADNSALKSVNHELVNLIRIMGGQA